MPLPLSNGAERSGVIIAGSLSHPTPEMDAFIAEQRRAHGKVEFMAMGSSLKICLVAEGTADVYPRFGPTMEWDTAAGHAIANAAGRKVMRHNSDEELLYNKPDLHNDWFIVR
jgi:3'(2'), 5'-bisphosphate nucleotidase